MSVLVACITVMSMQSVATLPVALSVPAEEATKEMV